MLIRHIRACQVFLAPSSGESHSVSRNVFRWMGLSLVVRRRAPGNSAAAGPTGFLTPADPSVSSGNMEMSIRPATISKGSDPLRKAIAFGIALVLASFASNQVDASPLFDPADHSAVCDCGPKCRQDRCCCRPASQEPQDDGPGRSTGTGNARTAAIAAKTICQLRSRCEIPADSTSPSKFRSLFKPFWTEWDGFSVEDPSARWLVTDAFSNVSPDSNRLDRPPRF